MKKVMVIGCPGSGKSTFSRALHSLTGIPLYHLDMMNWNTNRTTVEKTVFRQRLFEAIQKEAWILDGNYGSTLEPRFEACDTVFFLDYPLAVCLDGIEARKGQPRTDMPWVEDENTTDPEFLEFINNYNTASRPKVMALLTKYAHKQIFIFKSRSEADEFLKGYNEVTTC